MKKSCILSLIFVLFGMFLFFAGCGVWTPKVNSDTSSNCDCDPEVRVAQGHAQEVHGSNTVTDPGKAYNNGFGDMNEIRNQKPDSETWEFYRLYDGEKNSEAAYMLFFERQTITSSELGKTTQIPTDAYASKAVYRVELVPLEVLGHLIPNAGYRLYNKKTGKLIKERLPKRIK